MLKPNRIFLLFWYKLLVSLFISLLCPVALAQMPSAQILFEKLALKAADIEVLHQGDIVSFSVNSLSDMELTAGVVIYLPAPPIQVSALFKKDALASLDPQLITGGIISLPANPWVFKKFTLKAGSEEEAGFLAATPGKQFNLSTAEFDLIHAAASDPAQTASTLYQQILWKRWLSYSQKGLKGVAPYDRGNNAFINPALDLQAAATEQDVLSAYFPELWTAWLHYPEMALPKGVAEYYNWGNRLVQDRPTAILTHRWMISEAQGEVILIRQFYSGHSFNANQLFIICVPYENGSLVFYTNHTFTDQVSGFGSAIKHFIGDNLAQKQITTLLKNMQGHFSQLKSKS